MLIPLKKKYLRGYTSGGGRKVSSNSTPKKRTIWALLEENAKKGGRGKKR